MAKQVIILDTTQLSGGVLQLNTVLWFPVTVGQEIPRGGNSSFRGASTQENADLQAGKFVEEPFTHYAPAGTGAPAVKAQLQAIYANRLAVFNARPNPNQFYGLAYDGTVWA